MTAGPVIGVTAGRLQAGDRPIDGVAADYAEAVRRAGGLPVVLPAHAPLEPEGAASVASRIDGLLLTGGGDIDARAYGREPSPQAGGVDAARDGAELLLLRAALAAGRPVLGVCRGCQLVNVALGGTLHQHLPDLTPLGHLVPDRRGESVHPVSVTPGSVLAAAVGGRELGVNSIHHQGLEKVGEGLVVSARAPDGLVEAVELEDFPLLAVQWHPESLAADRRHLGLFAWLVGQAKAAPDRRP